MLKNNVLVNETEFYGVFLGDEMLAASTVFLFEKGRIFHTQYIATSPLHDKYNPVTYLYYCLIREAKDLGYKKLSWGISTEHGGKIINEGLTKSKEDYGSKHTLNCVYEKEL